MLSPGQILGKRGEDEVVSFLEKRGWKIIERNYRAGTGEIDIIAQDGDVTVFVEVKTRRSLRFGHPKEVVRQKKQLKIFTAAQAFLRNTGRTHTRARFDVAAVMMKNDRPVVELIRNAFESPY